jgi:hypothetical protein
VGPRPPRNRTSGGQSELITSMRQRTGTTLSRNPCKINVPPVVMLTVFGTGVESRIASAVRRYQFLPHYRYGKLH